MSARSPSGPKKRREHGDDGIYWDKINKCYVGSISLGNHSTGKRRRPTVRGKTKTEVKDKLSALHDELNAGIQTPATYTVRQCVTGWLELRLELDPHTMATYRGQAEKWIYPAIGATKLKDFKATDADRFFRDIAEVLSKASLVKIKSTLIRSIRRAQKYDLIRRTSPSSSTSRTGGRAIRRGHEQEQAARSSRPRAVGDGLRQGGEGEPGGTRRAMRPPRLASWRAAHGRASRLPSLRSAPIWPGPPAVLPGGTRPGRPHRSERQARSAIRAVRHARPPAGRAAQAGLGSRGPRRASSTCGGRQAGPGT